MTVLHPIGYKLSPEEISKRLELETIGGKKKSTLNVIITLLSLALIALFMTFTMIYKF